VSTWQAPIQQDLVVLVADKNMEAAIDGILRRPRALRIRDIRWKIYVHVQRDPGCLLRSADFLRSLRQLFANALVVFDHSGCGRDAEARQVLEAATEERLALSGWGSRAAAICIEPELEQWVWTGSPHVATSLGWTEGDPRSWLETHGLWRPDHPKPDDPKRAVDMILRATGKRHSSSLFQELASQVSLQSCSDPAFCRLVQVLREWFPPSPAALAPRSGADAPER
jgi:hypothetical protein